MATSEQRPSRRPRQPSKAGQAGQGRSNATSFTLNLDFVGLCLFVWERLPTPEKLHVLLLAPDLDPHGVQPDGRGRTGCATDRHHPRIFYNTAHNRPGADRLAREHSSIALDDKALDLSAFRGRPGLSAGAIPEALPNVSEIAGSPVRSTRVGPNPGPLVAARVTLAAGSGRTLVKQGPWGLEPLGEVPIAHKVRWTLTIDAPCLDWKLLGLNGRGGQPLTPLHPVKGEITLRVVNVVFGDLSATDSDNTNAPQNGEEMCHFKPFYAALRRPKKRPAPVWRGKDGSGDGPIGGSFKCGEGMASLG